MLAFSARRAAVGGLLLAVAILAKVFPAVVLPWLLFRRDFRALGWTLAWGVASTALTLALLGPAPFADFFSGHLPRLASGSAFAFDEAWPELAGLVLADNQGAFGLARKLGADKPLAAMVGRWFGLLVLAVAAFAGWRSGQASRWGRAASWLGLLGLGSLASAGAWGDYVPSVAVWLLALVAQRAVEAPRWWIPFATAALLEVFLLGTFPVEGIPLAVMVPVSAAGALAMFALYGLCAASPRALSAEAKGGVPSDRLGSAAARRGHRGRAAAPPVGI
jgi:alpha-1,2-mannosyltransferase